MKKRVTITFQPEEWLLARIEEYKKEFPNGSLTQFIHRLIKNGEKKVEIVVLCPDKGSVPTEYCMKECQKALECSMYLKNRELTLSYNVG